MSAVDERFKTVVKQTDAVVSLSEDLVSLGIFGTDEKAAITILMVTLEKAMRILDPEGAKEYVENAIKARTPEVTVDDIRRMLSENPLGNRQAGPYL